MGARGSTMGTRPESSRSTPSSESLYPEETRSSDSSRPSSKTMGTRPESSSSRPSSKSLYPQETRSSDSKIYSTIAEVTEDLTRAGLVSCKLIVGFDFTIFNHWGGEKSYHNKSLHDIGDTPNPYQQAMSIIGETLARFQQDNLIPCFGFGDATTHDDDVFSLCPDGRECNGFEEVLTAYKEIVPSIGLAGPTSFAPIIEMAMSIVEKSGGQFHVLLIITSGQLGVQKQKTFDAIVEASKFPISIILVGVGDGPWDIVKRLGDLTPGRAFDNLHFANFTEIMTENVPPSQKEAKFAQEALMKVPLLCKANFSKSGGQIVTPCPPHRESQSVITTPPADGSTDENEECPVCLANSVNMVLYCGHQICSVCKLGKPGVWHCPVCRIRVGADDYKKLLNDGVSMASGCKEEVK